MLQDRDKEYPDYFPKHWLDLYKFTENEKLLKKFMNLNMAIFS